MKPKIFLHFINEDLVQVLSDTDVEICVSVEETEFAGEKNGTDEEVVDSYEYAPTVEVHKEELNDIWPWEEEE